MTPALRFASLLRGGAALEDPEAERELLCWWLLHGRRQFPDGPPLGQAAQAVAWEPVPVPGLRVALPRLVAYLWARDPALSTAFDLATARGLGRLLAWFCCVIVPSSALAPLVPRSILGPLFEPDEETRSLAPRPVDRLLRFLWDGTPDWQVAFDLDTEGGQARLVDWFYGGGIRELGLDWLLRAAPTPATVAGPALRAGGVNLIGFAFAEFGVAEDLRMLARSCASAGIPFCVIARTPIRAGGGDTSLAPHVVEHPVHDVSILCMTGLDSAATALAAPALVEAPRHVIGYWPWELPRWPAAWQCLYGLVDELWAASGYIEQAHARSSPVAVFPMPPAVTVDGAVSRSRAAWGLAEGVFLFVYVFDAGSFIARKNPGAAVAAFRRAFPGGDEPVGLVLKTMAGDRGDPAYARLLDAAASDRRIRIIEGTLPRGEFLGLIAACDAYVSLHRAEGFGRTIAEAMLLRRPVVATGFSGSDELVVPGAALPVRWRPRPLEPGDYPGGDGQWWAEPDLEHAAGCLRQLAREPALCFRLGEAGYERVSLRHAPAVTGRRYAERLAAIQGLAAGRPGGRSRL